MATEESLLGNQDLTAQPHQKETQRKSSSTLADLLAGGLAGSVAKTVIAPLDRTKIFFQSSENRFTLSAMFRFLSQTYRETGLFSLWRGNTATLTRILPYSAIQFSSHEHYKHFLRTTDPTYSPGTRHCRRFLAGSMAGATSVACTYPLDFARARMAVTKKLKYRNVPHALITVWREEGLLTLYRGFTPTMLGSVPYSGTAFFTFETLKEHRIKTVNRKLTPLESMACGALAGVIGQTSSYPLDIVRRRMQTAGVTGHPEYNEGVLKTLRIVYHTEGILHGWYKGVTMNWVKGPLASGISFTVFYCVQTFLHDLQDFPTAHE